MVLYIDKENISSFVMSKSHPNFKNCERLIRNNMDIHCNFSKEEIKENEYLTSWFREYAEEVGGKLSFCAPCSITPCRPLKSNSFSQYRETKLSSVYLLNDNHICTVIADKTSILIGGIGQEVSVIERLIIEDTEEFCTKIEWDKYLVELPLTDIIICDNHYFKDRKVYEDNDNVIIKTLSSFPNAAQVNIVIIAKENEVDADFDLNAECQRIKQLVKTSSQSTKSTVTILTTGRTHDRHVISNYYRVKCGSCLHLKSNGIKGDVTAEIKSHATKRNFEITLGLMREFQTIASSPVKCYGDKKSNYLTF